MSLDVGLYGPVQYNKCICQCGNEHMNEDEPLIYENNITHNLTSMADAAGIYKELWRPEELNIKRAIDLIGPLTIGLAKLKENPVKFEQYNPKNKWGNYQVFVTFVEEYLQACKENPKASVRVSR